jgi:hypothetical protein
MMMVVFCCVGSLGFWFGDTMDLEWTSGTEFVVGGPQAATRC